MREFDDRHTGLSLLSAQFVQIISTDPGGQGTNVIRGHAQFWPNARATFQPGCNTTECSHIRAPSYYFASLYPENKFIGIDCSLSDIGNIPPNANLTSPDYSTFGYFNDEKRGVFCLQTTPCFPFTASVYNTIYNGPPNPNRRCKKCHHNHHKPGCTSAKDYVKSIFSEHEWKALLKYLKHISKQLSNEGKNQTNDKDKDKKA